MGFLDIFKQQPTAPTVQSILPDAAKQEILRGRLPILSTTTVFLKSGENCHYIDKAIHEKKIVRKRLKNRNMSYTMPGFFKGHRIRTGGGNTDVVDNVQYETIRGILYITNQRIIFVGENGGFDFTLDKLIAITPYSNCVEMQLSKENYKLFIPDGSIINTVMQLIKST